MKIQKIISFFLILGIIASLLVILQYFIPMKDLENITAKDRIVVFSVTITFFLLNRSYNSNPQLMPSILAMEKENDKNRDRPNISFNDVAGLEEIKEELQETIDFLNNSLKYKRMGAKIPKGIMFHGPPGTGKTLLAKAIAGETNSSFFYASGSEFVEKYVGVGAKRVRTLFEKAKKEAPSIIFIDEIDAIGSKRNLESNNEKDQTLNQLLVELDGFNSSETVIVVGATNRLDLLDDALLRPGRFDRHVYIGNPNMDSREKILEVHSSNKPLCKNLRIKDLAKKTTGLSGAELANIVNEAAIIAVRNNKNTISHKEFEAAIERVVAGLEIKNPTILLKEKQTVAFHEAGHALVSRILNTDVIQKISIIPRGQALGYVLKFPEEDRYLYSKEELKNKIVCLLAGRAAEEIIFNEVTTGAKDDLSKSTNIAREMVCSYGMTDLGNLALDEIYIKYNYDFIRKQIKVITDDAYDTAKTIINENIGILNEISEVLLNQETITNEELNDIFKSYKPESNCAT